MKIVDKIKEFFKRLKEDNKGFGAAMKRINASGFCGNVNRGIKSGDFWEGSYLSIENGHGVIYGSNQPDYVFTGEDIEAFEVVPGATATVSKGQDKIVCGRYLITFKDGKRAQADIFPAKLPEVKMTFNV